MKKLLAGVALAALVAAPALAADRPVYKAPPPPPPPVFSWTGFYIGVNAGGVFANDNSVDTVTRNVSSIAGLNGDIGAAVAARGTGSVSLSNRGQFIAGGQIGYNWQIGPAWVTGIEADIQGVGRNNSSGTLALAGVVPGAAVTIPSTSTISSSSNLDYLGTLRGRVGFLVTPAMLAYATGGLAYGRVEASTTIVERLGLSDTPDPFGTSGNISTTRVGWTAGGGVEWMLGQNWSAKLEYLYYDLGTVSFASPPIRQFGNFGTLLETTSAVQSSTRFNGSIFRAGLNYRFGYGPAAASY